MPQARVPSAKTWMLLNASPGAAEADSNWIFLTHTLKPLSGTLACQKMARQLTTAQHLWLSWFTPQVTMQMRNAGSLSSTPITQHLIAQNKKNNKRRKHRKNSNCSKTCMIHINCSKTFSTSYRNHIQLSCWLWPDLSKNPFAVTDLCWDFKC